jgi:hypothetical protein
MIDDFSPDVPLAWLRPARRTIAAEARISCVRRGVQCAHALPPDLSRGLLYLLFTNYGACATRVTHERSGKC